MPELADVDGYRRRFAAHAAGHRIVRVSVADAGVLRNRTKSSFGRSLEGRTFGEASRHGKWLEAPTDGPSLLFHFGMTGELLWTAESESHPYDRVTFRLDSGELIYRDQRKLQGIWMAEDEEEARRVMGRLGPDALGISKDQLAEILGNRRATLKPALMDQSLLAGLGNMLVDEILWHARLDPGRPCSSLSGAEISSLHGALKSVLRSSVRAGTVPAKKGWLTAARGIRGAACPRCGKPLRVDKFGGRSSWWCPSCQVPGRDAKTSTRG
jgi:formamidopyrimidine-DNA glycosylase